MNWLTVILITPVTQIGADYKNKEKRYRTRAVGGEVSEDLFRRGLCLSSGTALTDDDLDRVIETILNCRLRKL